MKLKHIGLFEGQGGFSLAAQWMGWQTVAWCENNEFCQKILQYYFPDAVGYGDIKKTDFTKYANKIDVLTGGFPCQPYSTAGKGEGIEDNRHLWPEMHRAVREIRPPWIVGENVPGLVNWGGAWYSSRCKLTWKLKGTKYYRYYFQLQALAHRTKGIESGLLPTPTAMMPADIDMEKLELRRAKAKEKSKNGNGFGPSLQELARKGLLPTPMAADWKGPKVKRKGNSQLTETLGISSQLNPQFVMEMMGFPPDWTVLPFLVGDQNQSNPEETP